MSHAMKPIIEVSAEQRAEMDERGFYVFPDVFTREEMEELSVALDAHERRMRENLQSIGGESGISRADEITFTDHIAEQDETVAAFLKRPEWIALTTAFLGPDVDLYWNQTVFKQPEAPREFPWHQDDAYTPVVPAPYLTLWLAINDATPENGCISVLPGSHLGGLRPHAPSPIGWVGYSSEEEDQGLLVPATAGSVIAFWSLTLHKSGPNRSSGIRKAFVVQFCAEGLRLVEGNQLIEGLMPIARSGQPA